MIKISGSVLVIALAVSSVAVLAQHSFTPEEVAEGGRLYTNNCAGCHGVKGDTVSGSELMTGKFKRATSDDELARLVGHPGCAALARSEHLEPRAQDRCPPAVIGRGVDVHQPTGFPDVAQFGRQAEQPQPELCRTGDIPEHHVEASAFPNAVPCQWTPDAAHSGKRDSPGEPSAVAEIAA